MTLVHDPSAVPVIVADDLSLVYPARAGHAEVRAVDGVSFSLNAGEILAILGETGSGKSALGQVLAGRGHGRRTQAGVPRIAGGEAWVLGERIRRLSAARRAALSGRIGYLAQDAGERLNPDLSVGEAVAEPLYQRDRRFDPREAGRLVAGLVDAVSLPLGTMSKRTWELSSGQRQRIALARSLILQPELLIADEPARGVDVLVRHSVLELLRSIHRDHQFSAVVITSSVAEARAVSDRIAVMRSGRIVGLGAIDDVLATTVDPYVKVMSQTTPIDIIPDHERSPKKHR